MVEVGPWRLLPSTTALSFLSVLRVLSQNLSTRRSKSPAMDRWFDGCRVCPFKLETL